VQAGVSNRQEGWLQPAFLPPLVREPARPRNTFYPAAKLSVQYKLLFASAKNSDARDMLTIILMRVAEVKAVSCIAYGQPIFLFFKKKIRFLNVARQRIQASHQENNSSS
jgi:hypothetical protein